MIRLSSLLYFIFFFVQIDSLVAQEERLEIKAAYILDSWRPFGTTSSDFGQQGNLDLTADLLLGKLGVFVFMYCTIMVDPFLLNWGTFKLQITIKLQKDLRSMNCGIKKVGKRGKSNWDNLM